jgi:hypothetical protein
VGCVALVANFFLMYHQTKIALKKMSGEGFVMLVKCIVIDVEFALRIEFDK